MLAVLIRAVVSGNAVTPPELAGDAPVADILHPAQVAVLEVLRNILQLTALYNVDSRLCKGRHFHEPLLRAARLNYGVAALACAYVVNVLFNLNEKTLCFKIGYHSLSCLVSVHSRVFPAVLLVYCGVIVHYVDDRETVAQTYLVVVGVVGRRDLYYAGPEIHFNVLVCDDRYLSVGKRELYGLADDALVALIVRVNGDRGIAEKRFGTCCCDLNESASVGKRVVYVPEVTLLLLILALDIRDRGLAVRTPVDDTLAVIDESLLVVVDEYLLNRFRTALVKREAFALPVAGRTQLLELILNLTAVLVCPVPCAFEESVASHVVLCETLGFHLRHDFCLGSNGSMVGSGEPQRRIALHALRADQYVLQCFVKGVTHVELSGNVRRRDNDSVGLLFGITLRVEVALLLPVLVDALLEVLRGVGFCEFFLHLLCPFLVQTAKR